MKRGSDEPHRLEQKKGKINKNDYKEARLELDEHGKSGKTASRKRSLDAAMKESDLSPNSRSLPPESQA